MKLNYLTHSFFVNLNLTDWTSRFNSVSKTAMKNRLSIEASCMWARIRRVYIPQLRNTFDWCTMEHPTSHSYFLGIDIVIV